jgi:type I restriction enzyme S subunit
MDILRSWDIVSNEVREGYKKSRLGIIPDDWKVAQLKKVAYINMGSSPSSSTYNEDEIGLPFFQGNADFGYMYPKATQWCSEPQKVAEKNDVLISVRAPVGELNIAPYECCIGRGLAALTGRKADTKYLFYYLKQHNKLLESFSQGSTFSAITKKVLSNFSILVPSLAEQQKIATILSSVDTAIEKTVAIIDKTKELKQGLMQELLTKGIGHNEFKKIRLGVKEYYIPKEWTTISIKDSTYLKGRIGWHGLTTDEYNKEGQHYLVTGTDFNNGKINWENCYYVDKERYDKDPNIQLKKDDVLLTKDGTIGKVAYVYDLPKKSTLNSGIFVLRPLENAYEPKYLYWILNSYFFEVFVEMLSAGSTISHLYQKDLNEFEFPLPPLAEQQKIASILSSVDNKIEKKIEQKQKLEELKKGLMQQLLTGQKRVKVGN